MSIRPLFVARAALAVLILYAVARLIDPEQRWAAIPIPGDAVEHAILVYALLTCALAAFPRLKLLHGAAAMVALGVAVELLQALPGVTGGPQMKDVAADIAGVALVSGPYLAGRLTSAARGPRSAR